MPARVIRFAVRDRIHTTLHPALLEERRHSVLPLPKSAVPPKERWNSKNDFFMTCIGYAIGLGNVWRFPYLCYQNGGGAFLIPYLLTVIFCGVPMFVLEAAWGQMLGSGGLTIWKLCPIFKGVGIASLVMNFWLNVYYIVLVAWALYYLIWAIGAEMQWNKCSNTWNTDRCLPEMDRVPTRDRCLRMKNEKLTFVQPTSTFNYKTSQIQKEWEDCQMILNGSYTSAVQEFWERRVLQISTGIDAPGEIQWELASCLAFVWLLCYLCIFRGVKWSGKIVYFTAIFPYVMMAILLLRSAALPGALVGIKHYLYPDFTRLAESKVWFDAVPQVFYSYGLGLGVLWALGSHNPYRNNVYKQCLFVCGINTATSIASGFVVFATVGFMAEEQGKEVSEVAQSGPGLLYIVYPSAVRHLALGPFWMALFFLMIVTLGLDSQFCQMEGFATALIDQWPNLRLKYKRELLLLLICSVSYVIGLSTVTQGGMYVFKLFDFYAASGWGLLWLLFFECIAISWCFGMERWYEELNAMIGYYPSVWWKFCWLHATPIVCIGVFIFSLIKYTRVEYVGYSYPMWADVLGWCMALSSMLWIPAFAAYKWCCTPGTFQEKVKILFRPDIVISEVREGGINDTFAGIQEIIRAAERYRLLFAEFGSGTGRTGSISTNSSAPNKPNLNPRLSQRRRRSYTFAGKAQLREVNELTQADDEEQTHFNFKRTQSCKTSSNRPKDRDPGPESGLIPDLIPGFNKRFSQSMKAKGRYGSGQSGGSGPLREAPGCPISTEPRGPEETTWANFHGRTGKFKGYSPVVSSNDINTEEEDELNSVEEEYT